MSQYVHGWNLADSLSYQYGGYNNGGYGQGGQGGNSYGQQSGGNPYGGQGGQQSGGGYNQQAPNPYGQQQDYGQQSSYGQPAANPYAQQGGRTQNQGAGQAAYGQDVEMQAMNGAQGQAGGRDSNAILNGCREVDQGIDSIEQYLNQLRQIQQRSLDDTNVSPKSATNQELDRLGADTMALYRNLTNRVRNLKSQPDSGSPKNAPQLGKVDRRLKAVINQYQTVERDFRKKLQVQQERQYRIVRPDASDAEVREAVEDTSNQEIFSQALLQGDRRGQSQTVLRQVTDRHEAIAKIEQQMIELAQLYQDMDVLVTQQEAAVVNIDQQGEQVTQDVGKANEQIGTAINSARARNRKKWWCLLICIILILIIVGVVAGVVVYLKGKNNPK